jgi:hypothetical protein
MMAPADALLLAALLLWCLALVRAIVHCLYDSGATITHGSAWRGRWLTWPVVLLAHYLAPLLSLRSRLAAITCLQRAGLSRTMTAAEWHALRWLSLAAQLLLACSLPLAGDWWAAALCAAAVSGWCLPPLLLRVVARWRRSTMLRDLPGYRDRIAVATDCGCALPEALQLAIEWGRQGPMREFLNSLLSDIHTLAMSGRSRRIAWSALPVPVALFGAELLRACTATAAARYAYPALPAAGAGPAAAREADLDRINNYLINEELLFDESAAGQRADDGLQQRVAGPHRRHARAPPL